MIYSRAEFPLEDGLRRDISKYINLPNTLVAEAVAQRKALDDMIRVALDTVIE